MKDFLNCIWRLIKKKIFNEQKTDIYQECEKVLDFDDEAQKQTEEYIANYSATTRWQTV